MLLIIQGIPPTLEKSMGGLITYLPEICSAELLLDVCLFSILENVSF